MRTKHYLAALCVPMAFAACSNEEFVNETPALGSRGTVNVTLSAEKTSSWGVDTRMTIDENNRFVWEKDVDNIGAAMADGAAFGTIQNDVLVNYPFTANNTGNASDFNAKSAIAQGNYLFYYGYTDVLDRGMLNLGVPAQTYNVAETKTPIQQAANQMKMISPIIELADGVAYKDAQEYKLNLSFVNLYTMVKVVVSSKNFPDGVVPTLKKISLNATGADGATTKGFATTANVDLTVIAGTANANVVAPEKDGTLDEDKMAVANKAINVLINGATGAVPSTVYQTTDAVYGPATLAVEGSLSLNATEEVILYILAPKGDYTTTGLTLDIETSEGNYTKAFKATSPAKMILGDGIQPLTADLNFDADNGNVTLPLSFEIASAADWTTANAFVASHALSYVDKTVTLNLIEDIEVAALPKFNATITGAKKLTLSGASAIKLDPAIVASTVPMIVKAGATLTLDAKADFASIENNGTLVVNADQDKAIQNNGTMNVQKDATLSGGVTNGKAETLTDDAIAGTINIAAGKKLTIGTVALTNEVGEVNILAKSELIGVADMVVNKAIINNFGVQNAVITNADGTVNIEKGSSSAAGKTITDGTAVVKDIAEYSGLAAAKRHVFAVDVVVVTSVSNAGLYGKANTTGLGITNVVLDGGDWTLANAKGGDATKIIVAPTTTVTDLTLAAANLTFDGVATLAKNISAEGASSISVKGIVETVITGALTVKEAATLTANNLVNFNELKTSNDKVATILGTLNVEAGAKLYFKTATVGSADVAGAKLNVKGNVKGIATGEFGVQDQGFKNHGTVSSLAGSDKVPAAGKVSQPENVGNTATFKGNASTFIFAV